MYISSKVKENTSHYSKKNSIKKKCCNFKLPIHQVIMTIFEYENVATQLFST